MNRSEQFLWGVQTLLLLYANHHAHDPKVRENAAHISAAGHVVTIHMAISASKRIPDELDVAEAVKQFHFAYVHIANDGEKEPIPTWLLNLA